MAHRPREGLFSQRSGVRKRVVSKRVILADVPPYQTFLRVVSPCSATLAEASYDFRYSWTPKPGTRIHPEPLSYQTLGVWRRGEIGKGCDCNTWRWDHTWNMFGTSLRTDHLLQMNYCTRNSRKNAIVLRPLRRIAAHELLHERLRQETTIAATPLADLFSELHKTAQGFCFLSKRCLRTCSGVAQACQCPAVVEGTQIGDLQKQHAMLERFEWTWITLLQDPSLCRKRGDAKGDSSLIFCVGHLFVTILFGPPSSQSLTRGERIWLLGSWKSVEDSNFLRPPFPGNWRMQIGEKFAKFSPLFSPNSGKKLLPKFRSSSFCA